jgi:UDP-N-acetylglucosamine 2-epimerase (non-hydrolysing)
VKICIVLGTRPEIIKFSPVIRELERLGLDYHVLHTNQHYSYNMDRVFFEQLGLPDAFDNLNVGSGYHGEQTGKMLMGVEKVLMRDAPDVVLVEGDTNTVVAGALAASKLGIKVGHVEAGLRSYDRSMPEEINRVLADHCSDYLFAPTWLSAGILEGEGIPESQIFVVGNTVVDAVNQNLELAKTKAKMPPEIHVKRGGYLVATAHRQENVDDKVRFNGILVGLRKVQKEFGLPLIYPIHPRARKRLEEFGLSHSGLTLVEPLDYLAFLKLLSEAQLVLTDSGGLQEETCIMKVPCVTLRDNTERPETLDVGSNKLAGTDPKRIVETAREMISTLRDWENPFGDGNSAVRIVEVLRQNIE